MYSKLSSLLMFPLTIRLESQQQTGKDVQQTFQFADVPTNDSLGEPATNWKGCTANFPVC